MLFGRLTRRRGLQIAAVALFCVRLVRADFHDWTIAEIYSNADGSVQFIELSCPNSGEGFLGGERIWCTSATRTNVFTFPSDLSGDTEDRKLLLATPGFAARAAMNCIILVLETPHFSATDDKGRYSIANLPAGTYKLKAWHERLPGQTREVVVPETGEVKIDFTLTITALPQY